MRYCHIQRTDESKEIPLELQSVPLIKGLDSVLYRVQVETVSLICVQLMFQNLNPIGQKLG